MSTTEGNECGELTSGKNSKQTKFNSSPYLAYSALQNHTHATQPQTGKLSIRPAIYGPFRFGHVILVVIMKRGKVTFTPSWMRTFVWIWGLKHAVHCILLFTTHNNHGLLGIISMSVLPAGQKPQKQTNTTNNTPVMK